MKKIVIKYIRENFTYELFKEYTDSNTYNLNKNDYKEFMDNLKNLSDEELLNLYTFSNPNYTY